VETWEWLNVLASVGFAVSLYPQLVRTMRLRRADDLSVPFLVLVNVASALMLVYMAHAGNWVFATAQVVNLVVWGTVLRFRLWPGVPAAPS